MADAGRFVVPFRFRRSAAPPGIGVPETGHVGSADGVTAGQAFAVITQTGKYGLLRITDVSEDDRKVTFEWLYQTDGSRLFR